MDKSTANLTWDFGPVANFYISNPPFHQLSSLSWTTILVTLLISYLTLVQLLRFRALRHLEHKYASYLSNPYTLTYKQAADVISTSLLQDNPFLFAFGTQWALVKSYGIATGTPLLVKTRQLSTPSRVGKRAEDTGIFIGELLIGDLDSPRGRTALAKMNWLHGRYADEILKEDYIHTLALFVLEPQEWIDRFGWRKMTELEKAAHLVLWREIGARMGFGDVPATIEELWKWRREYEKTAMYYTESNAVVAEATVQLFLRSTPGYLHGVVRSLFVAFVDEKKVREAIGFPEPKRWATAFIWTFFTARAFVLRHLCLPRWKKLDVLAKPGPDGRLQRSVNYVAFEPWYVPNTWRTRLTMWLGGKGAPGEQFKSEGYLPEELGPIGTEKVAKAPVCRQAQAMEEYARNGGLEGAGGCPFSVRW